MCGAIAFADYCVGMHLGIGAFQGNVADQARKIMISLQLTPVRISLAKGLSEILCAEPS